MKSNFPFAFSAFVCVFVCEALAHGSVAMRLEAVCCLPPPACLCPEGEQWPVIGPLLLHFGPVRWLHLSRAANRPPALSVAERAACRAAA